MYLLILPLGILLGRVDADNKVFIESLIENTSNHSIISQLQSVSKIQCLHKCKMTNGKCSDIVFENSGVGVCLLLKKSAVESMHFNDLEKTMKSLGMSKESSRCASPFKLPLSMNLSYFALTVLGLFKFQLILEHFRSIYILTVTVTLKAPVQNIVNDLKITLFD